jgi:thiamine pyrophosphokinase
LRKRILAESFNLVLGADKGALYAQTLNVTLDAVIGDMDSLPNFKKTDITNVKVISYPVRKDETDLELALHYAQQQGADHIVMVGTMGGRIDMTIGNLLLMAHFSLNTPVELRYGMGHKQAGL